MAKLILVVDIPVRAMALVDEMEKKGNMRVSVRSGSGRRANAFLGQSEQAPYANVLAGPRELQIEAAFVTDEEKPTIAGEGLLRRYKLFSND